MIRYALLDDNNICTGILLLHTEVTNNHLVAIENDVNPIGKKYIDGTWIQVDYPFSIEGLKKEKILLSKTKLAKWLEDHPMKSEIHNQEGEYYTVTQEKQSQLTQMLMLYSLAVQAGGEMQLTWNCTGGVCEEWTYEQLSTLSFQIAGYVLPRVKRQQRYEVQINECSSEEEVEAIEIEYDTI